MANVENLRPSEYKLSQEEAKKGGIASGEARRRKRDLRLALEMLLEKEFTDKNGNTLTGTEAITTKLFEQAMKGNVKAFETIRSTVGQDPVQKIEQVVISEETRTEIEDFLNDESESAESVDKTENETS